ncbi:Pvc16 family protein [Falsiroseomonas sp. E2-1-a4]|uniref:Pvc16 family protein n=1 Tax=Falsiroseomonas sp. E2-1-a4 TaxID=3239299 RepID=UPI003F386054
MTGQDKTTSIAEASAALVALLRDRVQPSRPVMLSPAEGAEGIALRLLHLRPDARLANNRPLGFDPDGTRAARPGLGLELIYLLTAEDGDELAAQAALGAALAVLHGSPVLEMPSGARLTVSLAPAPLAEMAMAWTALRETLRCGALIVVSGVELAA